MKSFVSCPCPADARFKSRGCLVGSRQECQATRERDQAGVALITVLLIVFIAAITATSLATMQQLSIRRSTVLQHQQQARLYTLGAEQWAVLVLTLDRRNSTTDHPGEGWASQSVALPVQGGVLAGQIRDLQGCFNLNNLWQPAPGAQAAPSPNDKRDSPQRENDEGDRGGDDADVKANPPSADPDDPQSGKGGHNQAQLKILQRLLTGLELKPELAQAVADWIDPDSDTLFPDGAEDSDYTIQTPPYLAANRPFASVSELRLVKGVDRETYDKLARYVCALPPGASLNVNTAPARVLAALVEGVELAEIERLDESRPSKGYENVDEFLSAAKLTVDAQTKALLGVSSEYFSLRAEARVGDGRAMLYSTLHRDENGVRVLRRGFGNQD